MRLTALACFLALGLAACADGEYAVTDAPTTDDGKADLASDLRVRIDGLTVWVAPAVYKDAQGLWTIDVRASRNLSTAFSYDDDDEFGEALITAPRSVSFHFGSDDELAQALTGHPILIDLTPTSGAKATVTLTLAPRVVRATGSSAIYLHLAATPIDGGYRVAATLDAGWTPVAPAVADDARHVHVDLASLATPVAVSATRNGTTATRSAALEARVMQVELAR